MIQADNPEGVPNRNWTVVGASARGSAHIRREEPCQDSWEHRIQVDPKTGVSTLIAAVADGAGSAPLSERGAKTATAASVQAAADLLEELMSEEQAPGLEDVATQAILRGKEKVLKQAQEEQGDARNYATTLLIVISNGQHTAIAQIGDGAAVAGTPSGSYELLAKPELAEYANETTFITSGGAAEKLQTAIREEAATVKLAMFTDGIQNLVLKEGQGAPAPHAPFFNAIFDWLASQSDQCAAQASLSKFLEGDKVASRTSDDTTLLLATLQ